VKKGGGKERETKGRHRVKAAMSREKVEGGGGIQESGERQRGTAIAGTASGKHLVEGQRGGHCSGVLRRSRRKGIVGQVVSAPRGGTKRIEIRDEYTEVAT